MINVGIIGAGFFAEKHAAAMAELNDVRLVAATRTNQRALAEFTGRFGGQGYAAYQELLADPLVDTVLIATPHHLHTDITMASAQAGKHILLEKPMAPNLAECDQILAAVAAAGVKLMVGHTSHFAPGFVLAKEMIASGEMGEVVFGVSTVSKFWFESNRRDWHLDRERGGGMWLTVGIHSLDRLTWLIGEPVTSVSAQLSTRFHDQQADDAGLIFLRYANGAAGTVVSTGYREGAPKHLTELTCTKGMLNINHQGGVQIGRAEQWRQVPVSRLPQMAALVAEWRAFADAIISDSETAVTGAFARHIMATVFAAEASSQLHREVTVPH